MDKSIEKIGMERRNGSWFSHLAVEVPGENTSNEWCEPVSDEEYESLQLKINSTFDMKKLCKILNFFHNFEKTT